MLGKSSSNDVLQDRWVAIRDEVRRLCPQATIVGVVKRQPPETIAGAVSAGLSHLGVNYVQEGEALRGGMSQAANWHFIGHIQSRKVKALVPYDWVQSLDRSDIAIDLNRRLEEVGRVMNVLVQVNIGLEPQKSGVAPSEVPQLWELLGGLSHLRPRGLMAIPPPLQPVEARAQYFQAMRRLYESLGPSKSIDTLSMGTSEDFRVALMEGATMVRLGTSLFGPRVSDSPKDA